jgi:hypothetical protein
VLSPSRRAFSKWPREFSPTTKRKLFSGGYKTAKTSVGRCLRSLRSSRFFKRHPLDEKAMSVPLSDFLGELQNPPFFSDCIRPGRRAPSQYRLCMHEIGRPRVIAVLDGLHHGYDRRFVNNGDGHCGKEPDAHLRNGPHRTPG